MSARHDLRSGIDQWRADAKRGIYRTKPPKQDAKDSQSGFLYIGLIVAVYAGIFYLAPTWQVGLMGIAAVGAAIWTVLRFR